MLFYVAYVASMLRGVFGTSCKSLKMLGTDSQHMRHEKSPERARQFSRFSFTFRRVGEVGFEPTKASASGFTVLRPSAGSLATALYGARSLASLPPRAICVGDARGGGDGGGGGDVTTCAYPWQTISVRPQVPLRFSRSAYRYRGAFFGRIYAASVRVRVPSGPATDTDGPASGTAF